MINRQRFVIAVDPSGCSCYGCCLFLSLDMSIQPQVCPSCHDYDMILIMAMGLLIRVVSIT